MRISFGEHTLSQNETNSSNQTITLSIKKFSLTINETKVLSKSQLTDILSTQKKEFIEGRDECYKR